MDLKRVIADLYALYCRYRASLGRDSENFSNENKAEMTVS